MHGPTPGAGTMKRIGIISDTHGLLRPEAVQALAGVVHIVHAGDIGSPEVIEELRRIAPVTAVRGNNDKGPWARTIPETDVLQTEGHSIFVLHDLNELDLDPAAAGFSVVVSGHSHKPAQKEVDGVLFLNPGSAGPRRFKLPVSLAILEIGPGSVRATIRELL
jgi:putative phosphoesterase